MPPGGRGLIDWWTDLESAAVVLDCLFPTGLLVPLTVEKDVSLSDVKQELWKEAQKFPFYSSLKDKNTYVFKCITKTAAKVELVDETRRLSEVQPFLAMLQVVEKKGNDVEKKNNEQISRLIGKGIEQFESLKSPEVSDFRQRMRSMCEKVAKERDTKPWLEQMICRYPPDVASDPQLPGHLQEKLQDNMLRVAVTMADTTASYTFHISCNSQPEELVRMGLEKQAKNTGQAVPSTDKYMLKVRGREEYFLGSYMMSQYLYIRRSICKGVKPELLLVRRDTVHDEPPRVPPRGHNLQKRGSGTLPPLPPILPAQRPKIGQDSWDISDPFVLHIEGVTNVDLPDFTKLQLRTCIYHGGDNMCSVVNTGEVLLKQGYANWDETVTFDIELCNIPRMARLCFLLYTIHDRRAKQTRPPTGGTPKRVRHGGHEYIALGWVNMPIFDYRDVLWTGSHRLYLWPVTNDDVLTEELLNPIGTVEYNPHVHEAVCLSISYHSYNRSGHVFYPPLEKVLEVAAKHIKISKHSNNNESEESEPVSNSRVKQSVNSALIDVPEELLGRLREVIERNPLDGLQYEQDKMLIWQLRYECVHHFPQSLPKLLSCVRWNNYTAVAEMQAFLQIWKTLPPIQALELLDFAYADKSVRSFAVKCIKDLSDAELHQYLLQLVQVLKYESHFECDLVEFLLERALLNRKIGHHLFWLLKSEMHVPSVSVQFGLILEAYCRGNMEHLSTLFRQVEALDRLQAISMYCKKMKVKKAEEGKEQVRQRLNQNGGLFSDLLSMMDPCQRLQKLMIPDCSYMDSKMKPLKLVWENADRFGRHIYMMYKKGDDLRQDMLTLQILRVMDNIWQSEGLDLRLNAYGCLSTGHCEGLIEIVTEANTVANIQKELSTSDIRSAFNKQCLYQWIRQHNQDEYSLNEAMEQFTRSCAGYCVATYVLGVGDRHSDNIMLRKNGQLFHIDFGHILGHFKSKFGVKRERVPFVLTTDFVYVIKRGPRDRTDEFERFRKMCEHAYMILRERSSFLITLFMMMMNTGIPEISSVKDIEYLKETLVPQLSDEDARLHFRSKFQEALKHSFWAKLNNAFHNVARDNQ